MGDTNSATGWVDIPIEIRCIILSFLPAKEVAHSALVSKSFHEVAVHDELWRNLCLRHFPNYDASLPPTPITELAKDLTGVRVRCYSEEVEDVAIGEKVPSQGGGSGSGMVVVSSWMERYRLYSRRLFVIHHKYNDINEGALDDALKKWKQAGAIITDVRASTDEFVEPRAGEWMEELKRVMKRHRVLYLFTDGGMKDWLRNPLGDTLAEFVEEGNCAIIGTFSNVAKRERPGGRWESEDYNPIVSESQVNTHHDLGTIYLPDHPIMKGITTVNALYKAVGKPHSKGQGICAYGPNEGHTLVAEMGVDGMMRGRKGLVISVNAYLPSSDSPLVGWKNEGGNQMVQLHGNILKYAIHYLTSSFNS